MEQEGFMSRDHDMLVTLNTKVDQLTFDIKDLKENLVLRMIKVEGRLDAIDIYHAGIPLQDFKNNSKWVDKIRANIWLIIFFGSVFFSTLGAIFGRILQFWLKF